VFGNYYCQAISAYAPNPHAARLWEEFLYSDEGQLLWLKGFAHPARFEDLLRRNVIPRELLAAESAKHGDGVSVLQLVPQHDGGGERGVWPAGPWPARRGTAAAGR